MAKTQPIQKDVNFSGGVTSYTNSAASGGTFYYINLGGIKLLWGQTNSVSGTGNVTVNFPASFFTTIQFSTTGTNGGYTNTNQITSHIESISTSSALIAPLLLSGTSPANPYQLFVIGT